MDPSSSTMLTQTHRGAVMQNQRMKPTETGSPSQESLYQMMLMQQQQDASFRVGLGANLHGHASLAGLREFPPLASSFRYPPMVHGAIDYSRQQLLQSIIAAEERQHRFAMQERLALQREQHFVHPYAPRLPVPYPETRQPLPLQGFSKPSNIHVNHYDVNDRKRSYEEALRAEPSKHEEHAEAKRTPEPAAQSASREAPKQEEEEEEKEERAPPSPKRSKPAPKKKAKKYSKSDDSALAPEPKKDTKWLLMLEELKEYKAQHGNCIVPRGFSPNPRLASWVAEQRKQYKLLKDGKPTSITKERVEKLLELDFAWNAQEAAWKRHMDDLTAFKEENGHCHVPLSHTTYPKLGLWVKEQRRHYTLMQQGKPSHMTEERAKALDDIGFCWDTHEATWLERLRQLADYRERHGDCMVPSQWGANPKLGTWVNHQRRQFKRFHEGKPCHITKERITQLEKLGFSWQSKSGDADASTVTSSSDTESDSGSLPPRKRHRLIM